MDNEMIEEIARPTNYPLPWCDRIDRSYWEINMALCLFNAQWRRMQSGRVMRELIPVIDMSDMLPVIDWLFDPHMIETMPCFGEEVLTREQTFAKFGSSRQWLVTSWLHSDAVTARLNAFSAPPSA